MVAASGVGNGTERNLAGAANASPFADQAPIAQKIRLRGKSVER
jgi:hypothetical protein